ncbi:hypothetical protein [Pararhizobium sp. IMCC21322]|uniref:hypothetical protein n=1 Tax=Pararhizobium sp. IMCC21322 TaxID=3067903 RepID=UPI0027429791|nr:hypothetical protein [Pararhizobium sp. IMCC21322]
MAEHSVKQTRKGRSALIRAGQSVAIIGLGAFAVFIFAVIIFADAKHFEARLKFEQFKYAWFGDWVTDEKLRPAPEIEQLADALAHAEDISFFQKVKWNDSGLVIITGTSFATAHDVVDGKIQRQWCYVNFGTGTVTRRIDLANKNSVATPVYADLTSIPQSEMTALGVTRDALGAAAFSHCRFGKMEIGAKKQEQ